ncbi:hypothetical protein AGMMS49982_07050 [Bacteroidia bacterium]|nr:hypothetical protein AGMMS49982_07050 [Bacteroidia bacterium]
MIAIFVVGYVFIALEDVIHINKTATALLLSTVLWVCLSQIAPDASEMHAGLVENLGDVAEILFFLMGAMTVVEIVDVHGGFRLITNNLKIKNRVKLLWITCFLAFILASVSGNLTTAIIMVALLRKLVGDKHDRWFFLGMVIVAANAGGAWSPIGDVTTVMLWISGKVSAEGVIANDLICSLASILVPLLVLTFTMKGDVERPPIAESEKTSNVTRGQTITVVCLGIGSLLFVPFFKGITHLPPYLGLLGGLSILWIYMGFLHKRRLADDRDHYSITNLLSRIDMSSILFFLGILMAVNALKDGGQLTMLSESLESIPLPEPNKYYVITILIGLFSSVVDNVPLVAAAIGMYDFPIDHYFWEFVSYTAGVGGSLLIIGSAAGVAVMGMEKIEFIWYLKKISWLALLGYASGCVVYILEHSI